MNKLEKAIIESAKIAQEEYEKMTGLWLSHGPESFLMCRVANELSREHNYYVFVEASPKRIMRERDEKLRGRPSSNNGQRFDMVVWQNNNDVRAIVEVKKAWNITGLRTDRDKVSKYVSSKDFVNTGYLLAYTEIKGQKRETKLNDRLKKWAQGLDCLLSGCHIDGKGDGDWGWAIGLFRVKN
jgi:hypothetical protein